MSTDLGKLQKKPGPKPKSTALQPRSLKSLKVSTADPCQQPTLLPHLITPRVPRKTRKSYPREFKLQALTMLQSHRMDLKTGKIVPVSMRNVARELSITRVMLQKWKNEEHEIVSSRKGARKVEKNEKSKGRWHNMEKILHEKFLAAREAGRPVGKKWFMREGKKIVQQLDTDNISCLFSAGWFEGFCTRWNVAWRVRTKVSQKAPADKVASIQKFLQEIRRKSQPSTSERSILLQTRFPKHLIYNMDQTPLPFEFLQQRTFDTKGAKTIYIHSDHTSWTKRQATLMLTASADGVLHCKPILIYHGDIKETKPRREERVQYHPDVHVIFNRTAYSNESITLDWIHRDICQMIDSNIVLPQPERLVTLDIFSGQMTEKTFEAMKILSITPVYIPDGCTGYVQPMDTIINKLVKDKISELLEDMVDHNVQITKETIGQRRVLITHAVAKAWDWLHKHKRESIVKSFEQAGISLSPDGSEDHKLHIRGLPADQVVTVGNWHLEIESDEELEFIPSNSRHEPTVRPEDRHEPTVRPEDRHEPTVRPEHRHEPTALPANPPVRISVSSLCN